MLNQEDFFSTQRHSHNSLWKKDGVLWDPLIYLENYLANYSHSIEIEIPDGVFINNRTHVSIGKGTVIDPGVLIVGPCIIGKNCVIRHGAFLREGSVLGDHCNVGHASEIKYTLLMDGATVSHFCYVGDSILGPDVNLGAGVKCANLRLDRKEVFVGFNDQKISTQLKKFGCVLGQSVQIGCNSVLNPGTLIGKNSIVYPMLNIGGIILPMQIVKRGNNGSRYL